MRSRSLSAALAALTALTVTAVGVTLLPASTATARTEPAPAPRAYVSGWLPYWLPDTATDSVVSHPAVFDEASPFVFDVQSATNIDLKVSGDQWQTMRSRLRGAGIDVIPTLATDLTAEQFASLLSSPTRRKAHVDKLVALANKYNVDGLDLDYESINFGSSSAKRTVRAKYPVLVTELQNRLAADGRVLSVTVAPRTSPDDPNWLVFDYKALGAAADRIRIMTYDFHWSGGSPGPIAPKWWVEDVVSFAVKQIDSQKVSLGLPAYGRDWFAGSVSGKCPASAKTTVSRSMRDMQRFASSLGKTPQWNERGTSRTFTYTRTYSSGGTTCRAKRAVWFDDARSVAEKIQLVEKYQLRGVAMWALGYETAATWDRLREYGQKIALREPSVALKSPADVVYGENGTVTATVQDAGDPVSGKRVTLQRRALGSTQWVDVSVARTDADGRARFGVAPQRHMQWRVTTARDWHLKSKTTTPATTRVAYAVHVSDAEPVLARGSRWTLTGSVAPAAAGTTVVRQKLVDGVWVDKTTRKVTATGRFSFDLRSRSRGEHAFRVVALPGALDRGISRPIKVNVG